METKIQKAIRVVLSPSQLNQKSKQVEASLTPLQQSLKSSLTASQLVSSWGGTAAQMACSASLSDVVKCQNIPTLADVNRVYGNTISMAIISEHLKSVFRYSGLDMSEGKLQSDTLLRDQLGETSFSILKGYYFLNLAELCIFFNELKAGRRGQFLWGSRINNQAIMVALHDFTLDRNKAITKLESERLNAENLKGCSTIKGMGAAFVKGINSIEELRKKAKSDFKAFRTLFPNLPSNYKENDLFLAYGGKEAAIQAIFGEDIPASEASEAIFRYLCDYNIAHQS